MQLVMVGLWRIFGHQPKEKKDFINIPACTNISRSLKKIANQISFGKKKLKTFEGAENWVNK